jgi:hypothetical protein
LGRPKPIPNTPYSVCHAGFPLSSAQWSFPAERTYHGPTNGRGRCRRWAGR